MYASCVQEARNCDATTASDALFLDTVYSQLVLKANQTLAITL